ncbi:MAG: SDR family NAD(P)-dependent oxidoreductase [Alteromonadaceae bacterium]|nr:SDR family NAD(P)-dependent oxidoreductase [Alteromonadaceae bacterium]
MAAPRNVVITGANRGIGLALTQLYLARGCQVWAICRQSSEVLSQTNAKVIEGVELTDYQGLATKLGALKHLEIDILINNAGLLHDEQLGSVSVSQIQKQYEINAIAPLVVTDLLLAQMREGGKIGFVTSRMGSMADNSSGGRYGYRMSKAALNAAAVSVAQDVKPLGIAVAILHPGYVQTGMVNFRGDVTAEDSASRLMARMDNLTLNNTGTFWHASGEVLPW